MNFNYVVIRQYLLKYYINYTITILSTPQIENISYDTINCYFKYSWAIAPRGGAPYPIK